MKLEKEIKVVIIHGQNHKGSTYHIAHMVAEKSAGQDGQHWKSQGWAGKVRPWKCEKNK